MSMNRLVSAAVLAAVAVAGSAQASVISGLRANDDIIIGDWFMPNQISGFQVGQFTQTPDSTTLTWSAAASALTGSGVKSNPLYEYGNSASNPLYGAADLRLSFGGLSSVFTWTNGQPVDLDFTITFFLSNAADATNTPLAVLAAKGKGTKNPPPPPPPPSGPISGGTGDDIIFGDYIISFNPNQPFNNPDGSPVDAAYRVYTGPSTLWSGLSVVPTPGAAALLGLGGLMASRRRRS
jgi:MYXO-CTERM domain-containing protein